eukprot:gb/GEZJ01004040.1/.p1 GENE.gb/GEZJ01004040.1/~~gb/GEZJ01004040.1/.p1  ORF type:complete len:276 (+),score=56.96 gb/GEZJ01004040.1/:394-1221(+)
MATDGGGGGDDDESERRRTMTRERRRRRDARGTTTATSAAAVAAAAAACALLLVASGALVSGATVVAAWHAVRARRPHQQSLTFHAAAHSTLEANASLAHAALQRFAVVSMELLLQLPETRVNQQHAVFGVSTALHADAQPTALATARARGAQKFRSPCARALRALALAVPLLLGAPVETQRVRVALMTQRVRRDAPVPTRLRVTIDAPLHVAAASLRVRGTPRSVRVVLAHRARALLAAALAFTAFVALAAAAVLLVARRAWRALRPAVAAVTG